MTFPGVNHRASAGFMLWDGRRVRRDVAWVGKGHLRPLGSEERIIIGFRSGNCSGVMMGNAAPGRFEVATAGLKLKPQVRRFFCES